MSYMRTIRRQNTRQRKLNERKRKEWNKKGFSYYGRVPSDTCDLCREIITEDERDDVLLAANRWVIDVDPESGEHPVPRFEAVVQVHPRCLEELAPSRMAAPHSDIFKDIGFRKPANTDAYINRVLNRLNHAVEDKGSPLCLDEVRELIPQVV